MGKGNVERQVQGFLKDERPTSNIEHPTSNKKQTSRFFKR
jgi:hypothetical protein